MLGKVNIKILGNLKGWCTVRQSRPKPMQEQISKPPRPATPPHEPPHPRQNIPPAIKIKWKSNPYGHPTPGRPSPHTHTHTIAGKHGRKINNKSGALNTRKTHLKPRNELHYSTFRQTDALKRFWPASCKFPHCKLVAPSITSSDPLDLSIPEYVYYWRPAWPISWQ